MYSQRRPPRPRNGYTQRGRSTTRNFESNGPANFRVRGKPVQIHDKYVQLARDSAVNGDKILTESLLQHAEHYLRLQTPERDRSAPERSAERDGDGDSQEGDSYRRFAPRSGSRRRWAVAPEGPARDEYSSPDLSSSSEQSDGQAAVEEQAQVEQRRPLSEGGLPATDNLGENERDLPSEAPYE